MPDLKNITLRQLRIFEAVASGLSYSAAAEQLGLTQPAVSMQLAQLQKEAGVQLLVKTGKRVGLSQRGDEFLRHTRRILDEVRLAADSLKTGHDGSAGVLHLGVVPTANYFAPALMMAFKAVQPGVRFQLTVQRRERILQMLQEHSLDMAIGGYPPSEADVEAQTFARHPHCVVAATSHPLVGRNKLPWAQLREESLLFREPGSATRLFFEHLLQSQSLQVKVSMELAGNETVKQAVMAGMGISFLSAHVFQIEMAAGRMAVLDLQDMPKWLDWCLLHRRDAPRSELAQAFHSFVMAHGARLAHCETSSVGTM